MKIYTLSKPDLFLLQKTRNTEKLQIDDEQLSIPQMIHLTQLLLLLYLLTLTTAFRHLFQICGQLWKVEILCCQGVMR